MKSRAFGENWTMENVAGYALRRVHLREFDGRASNLPYLSDHCYDYHPNGSRLILTRDIGHHSSGWWKNPDYERCLHLSLSFRDPLTGAVRPKDDELTDQWIDLILGPTKNLIWAEPPYSPEGKKNETWHYRVFYAPGWVAPILPRGEVYSKDWTPAGWLSFSDLQEKRRKEAEHISR